MLRLYEGARRRAPAGHAHGAGDGVPAAALPPAPKPGRAALAVAVALTWLMKLDVVLFGGIRTGPFFGLLRPGRGA